MSSHGSCKHEKFRWEGRIILMRRRSRDSRTPSDRRLRLDDDDVRRLRQLRDAGWTIRRLAALFGISRSQAGRIAMGVARVAPQRITEHAVRRARQAFDEGWTLTQIGDMLGLHRATVRRIIHD
jgi:transcriptional regulator with XRE-family HTH domain